ncbi:MAG TPA: hypothetical protein VKD90_15680 [Gemmataceae bacterium]|nr:hypothetical protein [Gemmataceae bacterium]
MKHIVEAGTDAATLALFDPAAMPEDAAARIHADQADLMEELVQAGRAYRIDTHADGNYTLHAYVDAPLPEEIARYVHNPVTVEAFHVPSGRLYFAGAEYASPDMEASLSRYKMGEPFDVRPGVYRLTVYEIEFPDGIDEEMLRAAVPAGAYGLHQSMGCFVWLAFLLAIGLGVTLFGLLWPWRYYLIPVCLAGIAWPFVLARLKPYRETQERYRAIQREHPAYVARLEYRGQ